MAQKPTLSIGMIFKNEARCLERCLKSLTPLRAALPCELVMADTGSDDGSREIAKKYADILFDFPWINDFAAARNAVLERCSGEWCLVLDSDEWLDKDFSELTALLNHKDRQKIDICTVTVRNYASHELANGLYTDTLALRLVRMDWTPRYAGAIHEYWACPPIVQTLHLRHVVLHHDGYVELNTGGKAGFAKRKRNMQLLQGELERNPDDMRTLSHMMDVVEDVSELVGLTRKTVALVEARKPGWETAGPSCMSTAVVLALKHELPELEEWIQKAEEWFPNSLFTCIDVMFSAFVYKLNKAEYNKAISYGEKYLYAIKEDQNGHLDPRARMFGAIQLGARSHEQMVRISLAEVYRKTNQMEQAFKLLSETDCANLSEEYTGKLALALMNLHANSDTDTSVLIQSVWEGICSTVPNETWAAERKKVFCQTALPAFSGENQEKEAKKGKRHTYTLFLPLVEVCDLGRAAAMLETEDKQEIVRLLSDIEDWQMLPGLALAKALECGVDFPLSGRPLNLEDMDVLAARLAKEADVLSFLSPSPESEWQATAWMRGLAMASVRACKWKDEGSMTLARAFADAERRFVPMCYTQAAIEDFHTMPSLHRFGWKCAQAFTALDKGDMPEYVRYLREALAACESMKPMVEFLTEHTPELQTVQPDPELMELAGKVHDLLNLYPQNDPAVIAIKQSPVYQRVAHLIEEDTL